MVTIINHTVMSDSLQPHGLQPSRHLCPWDPPGKNTGMGCHSLLQRICLTQRWNPGLLHYRQILYHLSHQGSPINHYQLQKDSANPSKKFSLALLQIIKIKKNKVNST